MSLNIKGDLFRISVMEELNDLSGFLDTVEAQLEEACHLERGRMQAAFDVFVAKKPNMEEEEFDSHYSDLEEELRICQLEHTVIYTRTLRYSFIVSLFILVETRLKAMCDEISKRKKLNLSVGDFRGSLFERTNKFFEKVVVAPTISTRSWEAIANLQKTRDCIVHAGGVVSESRDCDHIHRLIKNQIGLRLGSNLGERGLLVIERLFCDRILKSVQAAFTEIFEKTGCFGPDHWE